jgi:Transglycosylase SLT domain
VLRVAALLGTLATLTVAAFAGVLAVVIAPGACTSVEAAPSAAAERRIPVSYLAAYRQAGARYAIPWQVLAGIGAVETDHGRSPAPGVHSGVNRYGCCAGPMQFSITDGPPSSWARYRVDADHDGVADVYDPDDAINAAGNYLHALLGNAHGDLRIAILGYNHSPAYVNDVLAHARVYSAETDDALPSSADTDTGACAGRGLDTPAGPAELTTAVRVDSPRSFTQLPAWAMAAGRATEAVDTRVYADVVWILRRYHLRVTAAREAGHHTHGDGTAVDLVPAAGTAQPAWDASTGRLAQDLGWTRACAGSGSRPVCPLAPAIQFIGYDGYPAHGSPRSCRGACQPHLHISWLSPCYGTGGLGPPCRWVNAFTAPTGMEPASTEGLPGRARSAPIR